MTSSSNDTGYVDVPDVDELSDWENMALDALATKQSDLHAMSTEHIRLDYIGLGDALQTAVHVIRDMQTTIDGLTHELIEVTKDRDQLANVTTEAIRNIDNAYQETP